MANITIIDKGKRVSFDPETMSPAGRKLFEEDVRSGRVTIDADLPKIGGPSVPMEKSTFAGIPYGESRFGIQNDLGNADAQNMTRTMLGNLPGAVMSGGPVGGASAAAMALLQKRLAPSTLDKNAADTNRSLTSGIVAGGASKVLPALAKAPAGARAFIENLLGGSSGEGARQITAGESVDPAAMLRDGTVSGGIGAVMAGPERLRRGSTAHKSIELIDAMTGTPTHGKNLTPSGAGAEWLTGDLQNARVMALAQGAAGKEAKDAAQAGIERLKPKNLVVAQQPMLPKEIEALDAKINSSVNLGEKAYWTSRKVEETAKLQNQSANRDYTEKLNKSGVPEFVPQNQDLFKKTIDLADEQLKDLDRQAQELGESFRKPKSAPGAEGYTPESWMYGNVQRDPSLPKELPGPKEMEFMKLARERQRVIAQRDAQTAALLESDQNRLNQIRDYGYAIDDANTMISTAAVGINANNNAIPSNVRAAMAKANQYGTNGVLAWMKGASGADINEVAGYLRGKKLDAPVRDAAINDFFTLARNPATGDFSNIQQAVSTYPPEKLEAILGGNLKAERFRTMTDNIEKAVASSTLGGAFKNHIIRSGIHAVGSMLLFGENMHLPSLAGTGVSAGAAVLGIALPKFMNDIMSKPAVYYGFQDYLENAAKGIKIPLSSAVTDYMKKNFIAMTPEEARRVSQEAQQRLQEQQKIDQELYGQPQASQPPAGANQAPPAQAQGQGTPQQAPANPYAPLPPQPQQPPPQAPLPGGGGQPPTPGQPPPGM